jgi:hypothetical protein
MLGVESGAVKRGGTRSAGVDRPEALTTIGPMREYRLRPPGGANGYARDERQ